MILDAGAVVGGRYVIQNKLGSGGMAVVYKAKDMRLDRAVTLKVMREELMTDQEFIARFQVEARAAAGLSNSNIVSVYDVGQDGDMQYIVMEFIDGVTLKELIQRKAPFRNEETLGVAIQIASALAEAHANGVIHRDIKPQNILITGQGVVKVTDFGIAKAVGASTMTTGGNTMGSVHYFSPEQARGVYVDSKSDIYSLGIVMYEMATGQLPFEGESPVAVAIKHIDEPLPDMKALNPDISDSLVKIIQKAASKNTLSRYQTADELLADLKRALSDGSGGFVDSAASPEGGNQRPARSAVYPADAPDSETAGDMDALNEKRLERRIAIAAVITSLAIIFLISSVYLYNRYQNRLIPEVIPDVSGMTVDAAKSALNQLNMELMVVSQDYNNDYPEGQIYRQDEPAGKTLNTNSKNVGIVHVAVSMGVQKITVPDVVNKELNEAETIIRDSSLVLNERDEFSDDITVNAIISQDPPAGSQVDIYSTVTIVRSLGPEPKTVVVPDIVGKPEEEAINALQSAGLVVDLSSKAANDAVPPGYIVSQTVSPGTEVVKGSKVGYVISTGPAATATPIPTPTPAIVTKPLIIRTPLDVYPPVRIRVVKITDGMGEYVFDKTVTEFPLTIDVSGTGTVSYQVYQVLDDGSPKLLAEESVDFDDTGG